MNVTLNTLTRIDVKLDVGELTETVTVAAEVAQLQTDRAEVKSEIVSKVFVDLPVVTGRNYQGLFGTLPGITPPAERSLDSLQPIACPNFQRQWRNSWFQQYPHRRCESVQHLVASRDSLRSCIGIHRNRQHRDEQL